MIATDGATCSVPPFMSGLSIIASPLLLDAPIVRRKRWKRRGIGRPPKIRERIVGYRPPFFRMGVQIITTKAGVELLEKAAHA